MRRRVSAKNWPHRFAAATTAVLAFTAISAAAGQNQALAAPPAPGSPSPQQPGGQTGNRAGQTPDASRLADPGAVLPRDWNRSTDRAVTTVGDMDGLHVLVADEKSGYQWRTAATLVERVFGTDQWIGTSCVTGSGTRAVVSYAPREFTNRAATRNAGGFVAIVDLTSGAVRKLDRRASLAYYNPGCGAGEDVALSTFDESGQTSTTISVVDATTGKRKSQFTTPGQVTSAVPFAGRVAAASGSRVVSFGPDGAEKTLSSTSGVPFRLHPDSSGGLAYEVPDGKQVQVHRWSAGKSTVLGTGGLGTVRVTANAGRVFVTGTDSAKVRVDKSLKSWTRLAVPVEAEPSTTGALAVLSSSRERVDSPKAIAATAPARRPEAPVAIQAKVTGSSKSVSFSVRPAAQRPAEGSAMSPALTATPTAPATGSVRPQSITPQSTAPSTVPWDPDAACSVPRNDPSIQTLQATGQQVEWAVDLAVVNQLKVTRPANWQNSGMPISWKPQTLFPLHTLIGGGNVPAQVLLGALAQESNTMQASPHAVDGLTGNVNQGGFYGDRANWNTADCGYGAGQVTSGMAIKDGTSVFTADQQKAIATDYASNIAASLNILIDKWNALKTANIIANNGDPQYIENWYFAAWAYNSGIQPDAARGNTTGCTPGPGCNDGAGNWGLGWLNNPANPDYPVDRGRFDANNDFHTKHPNLWPYQEKVIGWAYTPVARYDYSANTWRPAYSAGSWNNGPAIPDFSTFCDVNVNHCSPRSTTDINGKPGAGNCQLTNFHCWWNRPITWAACADPSGRPCGTQVLTYSPGALEPPNASVYPPDCSMSGLPNDTVIVNEVRTPSAAPCSKTWTDQGQFTLSFPATTFSPSSCPYNCITYQGKIDFHQLGTGFGGHLWFTHMNETASVTGTWTPPSRTGWTKIKVHIPESGATTKQADYIINLGNGQTRHRIVNQNWWKNTWVDLGTFNLAAGASVSLSNASLYVADGKADGGDVAFDALAFIPSTQPIARYVALGDSYSSGESAQPYDEDSNLAKDNLCHRSKTQAFSHAVRLPGQTQSIATLQDNNQADFHFLACSGAQSIDLTQASVRPGNTDNTDWRTSYNYHYGEVDQIDASGWLDQDTTLVTISIGGNDVGFGDVALACMSLNSDCLADTFRLTRSFGDWDGDRGKRVDPQKLTAYEPYLITQLQSHLTDTYKRIRLRAPNAKVIVVGYPRLFTPGTTCTAPYSLDKQDWMNMMADQLNQVIKNAVADTRAAYPTMDIRVADPTNAFSGHGACDSQAWINDVNLINKASSFHPNATGQAAYATLVNNALAG